MRFPGLRALTVCSQQVDTIGAAPCDASEEVPISTAQLYEDKSAGYFGAVGLHVLSRLPGDCRRVLELGCGTGATGAAAKAKDPGLEWIGVEMVPDAAQTARSVLDSVHQGDIADIPSEMLGGQFDAIVASEVLEHLVDPWQVVANLARHLRHGGVFIASTPNIASRHVIAGLVRGRFDYCEEGVMDRTHLRWFTPASFAQMFAQAGLAVQTCEPVEPLRAKASLINRLTGGHLRHLFHNQIVLVARRD